MPERWRKSGSVLYVLGVTVAQQPPKLLGVGSNPTGRAISRISAQSGEKLYVYWYWRTYSTHYSFDYSILTNHAGTSTGR